jgi:hypothetical protein
MAVSDELKPGPCPFCGSDKTAVCGGPSLVDPDTPQFYVECNGNRKQCAALGPDATTEAEAIARWNAAGQIQKFWKEQSEWSQQTFGADSDRGPIGPLKHLEKEAREAYEAAPENRALEIVDCLFLSFDAARRHGLTLGGLIELCFTKLAINRSREWPKNLPPDSAVEHYRTNAEG